MQLSRRSALGLAVHVEDAGGDQMNSRLRTPGGRLGTLSIASAYLLAVIGMAGVVMLLISLAFDLDLWADKTSAEMVSLMLFGLAVLGAVGFLLQDRSLALGTVLAIMGGLAFATTLWWAILPAVLGVGAAVVAFYRMRALAGRGVAVPPSMAT